MCEFSAQVEGRVVIGIVKTKEEAQNDYSQALQTGHSAFLLEEKLPDVFKVHFPIFIHALTINTALFLRQKLATWHQDQGQEFKYRMSLS